MREFPRPRVLASKCLEFDSCRYNGLKIASPAVKSMMPFVDFVPVCAEVEIGLGVPREPIRIVTGGESRRLVQPSTGLDVTGRMNDFCRRFLDDLGEVDGVVLKSRSPSCGVKDVKVYPSPDAKNTGERGSGFFGGAVAERMPITAIEEEGRLNNFRIREHFYTRIWTSADFRRIAAAPRMKDIVDFQTRHKLMLMAYSQTKMRELGRIVANTVHAPAEEVFRRYGETLAAAMANPPRFTSNINVLMHAFGYFSKELSAEEKAFFLDTLEDYRAEKIPLSACQRIVMSWIARFSEPWLSLQTYFQPYPAGLVEITDSGKGRKLSH